MWRVVLWELHFLTEEIGRYGQTRKGTATGGIPIGHGGLPGVLKGRRNSASTDVRIPLMVPLPIFQISLCIPSPLVSTLPSSLHHQESLLPIFESRCQIRWLYAEPHLYKLGSRDQLYSWRESPSIVLSTFVFWVLSDTSLE